MKFNTTPDKIIQELWSLIEDSIKEFGVVFTTKFSPELGSSPTVVWSIQRRTPDREGDSAIRSKQVDAFEHSLQDDKINTTFQKVYLTTYNLDIYGSDYMAISNLAFKLEFLLEEAADSLKHKYPTFEFHFQEEVISIGESASFMTDLFKKTIRFYSRLGVTYNVEEDKLQEIDIKAATPILSRTITYTKDTDAAKWRIPLNSFNGITIVGISYLQVIGSVTTQVKLEEGIDYSIIYERDEETNFMNSYIVWNSYGKTVAVGQDFKIDALLEHNISRSSIIRN